ncbi:hypothetical protein Q5P01_004783 [Channa striata]|uniref:SAYSvFN domain-containing protein n=1 Tax=Channa striata TaxID=64152 RepID=A0AA88NBE7_CHASR|nr:hypothetical protein Q5P01_004783 [Channa striata]
MEQKLAEFRARRQAEKANKEDPSSASQPRSSTPADTAALPDSPPAAAERQPQTQTTDNSPASTQGSKTKNQRDWLLDSSLGRWLASKEFVITNLTLLKVLLWLVLLGLFVELEFGLPFFVLSLFYWLYEGLRSPAAREPGELSAYSVFNPDCQPLLGSLTAEQLEGEMGYRPLANR